MRRFLKTGSVQGRCEEFYSSYWRCHWWRDVILTRSLFCCVFKTNAQFVKNLRMFVKFVDWKFTSYTVMEMSFIFCKINFIRSYLKIKWYQILLDTLYSKPRPYYMLDRKSKKVTSVVYRRHVYGVFAVTAQSTTVSNLWW